MSKHMLFVYGTLRRGGVNEITNSHPGTEYIGDSSVRGRLYDMGGYPAIILDEAAGSVAGEVFEVDDAALAELDSFEAADGYHREQIEVPVNDATVRCWIFRPAPEFCSGRPVIESNDWIEYAKASQLSHADPFGIVDN